MNACRVKRIDSNRVRYSSQLIKGYSSGLLNKAEGVALRREVISYHLISSSHILAPPHILLAFL
jgi:hypothetical protein